MIKTTLDPLLTSPHRPSRFSLPLCVFTFVSRVMHPHTPHMKAVFLAAVKNILCMHIFSPAACAADPLLLRSLLISTHVEWKMKYFVVEAVGLCRVSRSRDYVYAGSIRLRGTLGKFVAVFMIPPVPGDVRSGPSDRGCKILV